ncbi:S-adenosyl-L-methionine-dependent methyltransferase [Mycena vitilis]|nr:S-adenosyl-L-methionine-dependent methyltransferase [Mycena vitilis]
MPSPSAERPHEHRYILKTAKESDEELQRLEGLHTAIIRYFDGQLSRAPLTDLRPQRIVDLGCGTGSWSIDAATQFPDAQIFAVDRSPLPERKIPVNVQFVQMDLTKDLGLQKASFDVVHARLVMIHLPDVANAVKRAAELVKPGGILLLEEPDGNSVAQTGGPASRCVALEMIKIHNSHGADFEVGRKLAELVTATGYFPHVHVHRAAMPFSGTGSDEATNTLGLAFKKAWMKVSESLSTQGITEAMLREQNEELEDKECTAVFDMYFCWAQRALE